MPNYYYPKHANFQIIEYLTQRVTHDIVTRAYYIGSYTDTIYRFDGFYGIIRAIYLTNFDTDYDTEVLKKTDF